METWERRLYRGNKVWVRLTAEGEARADERGLVPMRYHPDDERTYTVRNEEVGPLPTSDGPVPVEEGAITGWAAGVPATRAGLLGVGVVLGYGTHRRDLERRVAHPDPAVAAALAAWTALTAIRRRDLPVRIHVADPEVAAHPIVAPALDRFADARLVPGLEDAGGALAGALAAAAAMAFREEAPPSSSA